MASSHDDTFDLPDDTVILPENASPSRRKKATPVSTPEMDNEEDRVLRGRGGSMMNNLLALEPDECYTRSIPFSYGASLDVTESQLNEIKHRLRQSVNQAMRRAIDYDGRRLSMETNHTMTPSGRVYVQVIVTRTA